jgi:hypothetical protein
LTRRYLVRLQTRAQRFGKQQMRVPHKIAGTFFRAQIRAVDRFALFQLNVQRRPRYVDGLPTTYLNFIP